MSGAGETDSDLEPNNGSCRKHTRIFYRNPLQNLLIAGELVPVGRGSYEGFLCSGGGRWCPAGLLV